MFINKIGAEHISMGVNCQDYGFEKDGFKLVCDGCSEGNHSEVGAKTYCHLASQGMNTEQIFEKLVDVFGQNSSSIKNFLCFTILYIEETATDFNMSYCGDGCVILQDLEGNVTFDVLTDGEYPKYYSYNYCNRDSLKYYKEGVTMTKKTYSKNMYSNVGVASDGLSFILKTDEGLKNEFITLLKTGNAVKLKRFINRNQNVFKDDVTIIF